MKRLRKGCLILVVLLAIVSITLVLGGIWLVRRSWPPVSGTVTVTGLSAPVEIARDKWGVPYIYAQSEQDLLFAQGYVHAQDRLWQMEFSRSLGSGTLSAILGEATLDTDRFVRTVGLRRAAEKDWTMLDAEARALLEAYAAGVNAYVNSRSSRVSLEYTLVRTTPSPWTPIDTLTIGKLMGWQLSGDYGLDLLRAQAIAELGKEAAEQIFSFSAEGAVIPTEVQSYDWFSSASLEKDSLLASLTKQPSLFNGSNSWVIHGSRTATGMPMFAIDTHLGLNMPAVWYINGLKGGRFDSVGFSLPGVPLVIIGHNQRIAWGTTNLSTDLQELFIEKLDDADHPTRYEFMGEWRDLQVAQEIIEIKGGMPVTLTVYSTHHGPIINDIREELEEAPPLAMQWTDLQGSRLFKAVMLINLAGDWKEFRKGLEYWDAPKENFVYADVDGNIGYQAAGKIPLRVPGSYGVLPVPGWTGTYEWQGFIPFEDMPTLYNPQSGFIVSANSQTIPAGNFKHQLEYFGMSAYRAERIANTLAGSNHLTIEDSQTLQGDTFSSPSEELRPYLLAIQPADDFQKEILALLNDWDLKYEPDRVGAAIYEAWRWFLEDNVMRDELGDEMLYQYRLFGLATAPKLNTLVEQPDNSWFDDITTPQVETRDEIISRSLVDAIAWLREHHGSDPAQWQWGRLHPVSFFHQPFGQSGIPPLEYIFNTGSIPARGSDFTINNGWFSVDYPFVMQGGVSQRLIVDLGDIERGYAILTTGQSEHVFHPHREDMMKMWQNLEYIPLLFTAETAKAQAKAVLTLDPGAMK